MITGNKTRDPTSIMATMPGMAGASSQEPPDISNSDRSVAEAQKTSCSPDVICDGEYAARKRQPISFWASKWRSRRYSATF